VEAYDLGLLRHDDVTPQSANRVHAQRSHDRPVDARKGSGHVHQGKDQLELEEGVALNDFLRAFLLAA